MKDVNNFMLLSSRHVSILVNACMINLEGGEEEGGSGKRGTKMFIPLRRKDSEAAEKHARVLPAYTGTF